MRKARFGQIIRYGFDLDDEFYTVIYIWMRCAFGLQSKLYYLIFPRKRVNPAIVGCWYCHNLHQLLTISTTIFWFGSNQSLVVYLLTPQLIFAPGFTPCLLRKEDPNLARGANCFSESITKAWPGTTALEDPWHTMMNLRASPIERMRILKHTCLL